MGLLLGDSKQLLAEALEGMRLTALRLPEELLPLALDEHDPQIRELLLPLLGERGRWLLERSRSWERAPDEEDRWEWARIAVGGGQPSLPDDADRRWEEGTVEEREVLLGLARRVDPARALGWVASTFKNDKAELRKRWLELLGPELSSIDAQFLEAATNDRSGMVRLEAARLAWHLSETTPARRVRELVAGAIAVVEGKLVLRLPKEPFDPALERIGIAEAPPPGVGRRQWWLAQLVSGVPPSYFHDQLHATAPWIDLAVHHELGRALLDGWTRAALRFGAQSWYTALWDAWFIQEDPRGWTEPEPLFALTERLALNALPEIVPRLIRCIREARHPELLSAVPRPWPSALAEALFAALDGKPEWFPAIWASAATAVPLGSLPSAQDLPVASPGRKPPFEDALGKFSSVIDLRRRIAREIATSRGTPEPNVTQEEQ